MAIVFASSPPSPLTAEEFFYEFSTTRHTMWSTFLIHAEINDTRTDRQTPNLVSYLSGEPREKWKVSKDFDFDETVVSNILAFYRVTKQ
jgi:hypothetical protein